MVNAEKYMDIIPPKKTKQIQQRRSFEHNKYTVKKFIYNLESRGGVVGDKAVLVVYDRIYPERSYLLVEDM